MRFITFIIVFTLVYASGGSGCGTARPGAGVKLKASQASSEAPAYVPGELLVKFKPEVSKERIPALLEEMGTQVIQVFENLSVYHLHITSGESTEAVIHKFSSLKEVEYAEPNYKRKALAGDQ